MPRLLLSLLLFTCFHASFAQYNLQGGAGIFAVKGTVVDSSNQAMLGYVTVSLLDPENKQQIKHALTQDDGSFQLTAIPANKPYQLVLAYVGYRTHTIPLPAFTSPILQLGIIKLSPAVVELQEVQVQTEQVLVEQDMDKLTYHVEADPEQHTLSALEMMRKVPFLSVDGDNKLQLNGSDSYVIHINGKPSSLFMQDPSEIFQSIPASSIKRIEVMTSPPARYDAEGVGGIINIVTHRKTISGYNGSVNVGLVSPKGATAGGYVTAKTGKMGFSGNFSGNTAFSPPARSSFRRDDRIRQTQLQQTGSSNNQYTNQFVSGELNYEHSALNLLSASYRFNTGDGQNNNQQLVELFNREGASTQGYRNLSNGRTDRMSSDLGLDYQRSFKNNTDRLFTLSYKAGQNNNTTSSEFSVEPLMNYTGRISQTSNEGSTREHTLQADYVQPIGKQTLELGLKSNFRTNASDYFYQNQDPETGAFVLDPRMSNNFDYQQDIHAAYASLSLQQKNWGLRVGGRIEETFVKANFSSSDTTAKQHYQNLIPNLNLSRKLKGNSTIRLSYAQRLERPSLFHINPYVNLTDPRNISYGNPELDPAVNHVFNLAFSSYQKGTSINGGLSHQFTNNSIQYLTTLGEDTVARSTFANIGRRQTYGLTLGGNTTLFKKLNLSINTSTNYVDLQSTRQGRPQQNTGITWNASGNVNYRFSNTWRLSGNIGYTSPQVLLQGKSASFVSNNFSVNKELLKNNKASLSFSVRNPFQKYRRFLNEVNDPAFYQWQESYSVIRQYNATFNYRFGKVHTGGPRKKQVYQERE